MGGTLRKKIAAHKYLYILLLPAVMYYLFFSYAPMYGIVLAFKEFRFDLGVMGSPWTGWRNFEEIMRQGEFWRAFNNTIVISLGRILFEFPAAIIMALLINEVTREKLKRFYQTVYTFPHFLSWVILSGIVINLLNDAGVYNQILTYFGFEKSALLTNPDTFRPLLFISNMWKEVGWGAIIYLAAIAGINPELYEAAYVDGAGRLQQLRAITWPSIRGTAAILLILAVGGAMNGGFEQVFNLYNPAVYVTGDIIDTYVFRTTFEGGAAYGQSTAVGLFKSLINFSLIYLANFIVRKMGEEGML